VFKGDKKMLVILQDERILSPEKICQGCVLATQNGFPRWSKGTLGCGQCIGKLSDNQPTVYQCKMGFHLANIE
jgi:hypothetical protein